MMAFLLHFKDDGTKKIIQKNGCFLLCIIFYQIYCVIFYYIPFIFQTVSYQMVPRICISLLQDLTYRQLDLGMSF